MGCADYRARVRRCHVSTKLYAIDKVIICHHWGKDFAQRDKCFLYDFIFSEGSEGGGLEAFIGTDKKEIALSELVIVPPFLRFDIVILEYQIGSQSIAQKCKSFHTHLPSIKSSLCDSLISFVCEINKEDSNQFSNCSALLEHIRNILSICDSSRGYSFFVLHVSDSDENDNGNGITSILEIPVISRSSTVYIFGINSTLTQSTIKAISNWLNRERNEMDQKQRERNLALACPIQDGQLQEMCDFLKQVPFILNIYPRNGNISSFKCSA